jgi:hypothetical protein
MDRIRDHLALHGDGSIGEVLQIAVSAGRGIGKSALVCMLMYWFISTRLGATVVFTANTEQQMKSRLWAEFGKWHTLACNSHWFVRMSLLLKPAEWFGTMLRDQLKIGTGYYYVEGQTWSEETPGAFAGLHNDKGMFIVFEEAADIPDCIWDVTPGFFTEESRDRFWFVISNPRHTSGMFYECFHRFRSWWKTTKVDARAVEGTDKRQYEKTIEQYGLDSYQARVEILGDFPVRGGSQLIAVQSYRDAVDRELFRDEHAPLLMGCDIARSEDGDNNVIWFRQGVDCRSIPVEEWKSPDTEYTADRIAQRIDQYKPDAVMIDEGGVGGPVIDKLRHRGYIIHGVMFGAASRSERYGNRRTDIWVAMAEDMRRLCLPDLPGLQEDFCTPQLEFYNKQRPDRLYLESKESMGFSPDKPDALAMTYAFQVPRRDNPSAVQSTTAGKSSSMPVFSWQAC